MRTCSECGARLRQCVTCDGPLPPGSREDRRYCSKRCNNVANNARVTARNRAARDPFLTVNPHAPKEIAKP